MIYSEKNIKNENLLAKVYFNWGAAHADNPRGNLEKAIDCYTRALESFKKVKATDDVIRTNIRIGKVHLLQKNYDLCQKILDEVRHEILSERIAMQVDYLEAQLKFALDDKENAIKIARNGIVRAKALDAKEDESRFLSL